MNAPVPPELQRLREAIDAIDEQLIDLFNRRAGLAREVGETKRAMGEGEQCYRPGREAQVLRRARERSHGPLAPETAAQLLREVMSACLALEQQLVVACLGPAGSFTWLATLQHFGHAVEALPLAGIDEVFRTVAAGRAHYGLVPVENSVEGAVNVTLDCLARGQVRVCGELALRIRHNLLGRGERSAARRVLAHQQALAQCRGWLDRHLPGLERVAVASNAEAARMAAEDDTLLAIAAAEAAPLYKLQVLEAGIEDDPANTTRFLVIGRHDADPSGDDKTSLMFYTRNEPGSLYRALAAFADNGVSMTRIESRPARRGGAHWEYVFFVDLAGHLSDPPLAAALAAIDTRVDELRILGSYPRARSA